MTSSKAVLPDFRSSFAAALLGAAAFLLGCKPSTSPSPAAAKPQPATTQAAGAGGASPAQSAVVTVFAAASATDIINEAASRFKQQTGVAVQCSFDSSSNLAKQIKAGAPADLFISADEKWMDDAQAAGVIQADSRVDLLANELVLIAPKEHPFTVQMSTSFDVAASLPDVKRIAVGDPAHVPAGRYAKASLEWLGWWQAWESKLIPAQDVRAALRLVELGEADAGIVYSTDAMASTKVQVVGSFPAESHEPIHYPLAVCSKGGEEAKRFAAFLRSDEMAEVFRQHGFTVLK